MMRFVVLTFLTLAALTCAAPADGDDRAKLVTGDQVDNWTRTWQKRLHLEDWHIDACLVRAHDLKPDTLGNLQWNSITRSASIKILSPLDYELGTGEIPEDIEYTIVHELVHLQLSALPRDNTHREVEEAVVNKLTDALMSLDKGPSFHARSILPFKAAPVQAKAVRKSAEPPNGSEVARGPN